jgi:hypothetical protein
VRIAGLVTWLLAAFAVATVVLVLLTAVRVTG